MVNNEANKSFQCCKCGCTEYSKDSFAATGTGLSRMFDVQNRVFITISCIRCGYTEIYRKQNIKDGSQIFDFLIG